MKISNYIKTYLSELSTIAQKIDQDEIKQTAQVILNVKKQKGRIFFLGVGGGAGTGSHAANDFNKIAGVSTVCLSDNSSLLTALANDEGWKSIFKRQLEMHDFNSKDCIFIYSVSGGTDNVSNNLVEAIDYAKKIGAKIVGVVGENNGATAKKADSCIVVPWIEKSRRTPHTEDFQLIIDHLLSNLLNEISKENVKN